MKINMASPVNMYNNKQYNKSQPAFGKFIVENGNPSPQLMNELLNKKEFGDLVKDADNKDCDIVLKHDGYTFCFRLGVQERKATAGVCHYQDLIAANTFECIIDNLQDVIRDWKKFKDTTLSDADHQVKALVNEFNKRMGFTE